MGSKNAIENLFGIEGFNIAWYGVIITCGMLLAGYVAVRAAKKRGYSSDLIIDFMLIAMPISVICARAYYVIFKWSDYSENPMKIFATREGGLAIYGGVIGGIICVLIFTKIKKIPLREFLDIAAPSLILGQAIGRWGNFMNQEAFGNIITDQNLQFFPYGVYIDALKEWHQATFFYESMWSLAIFIVLMIYRQKSKYKGELSAIYLIGYGIGRLFIEGLRTDSLYLIANIRVSQVVSAIFIISGIVLLYYIKKIEAKKTKELT